MTVALVLVAALAVPGAPRHVAEVLGMWHPRSGGVPADLGIRNVTRDVACSERTACHARRPPHHRAGVGEAEGRGEKGMVQSAGDPRRAGSMAVAQAERLGTRGMKEKWPGRKCVQCVQCEQICMQ